jgi:hypothetical protein
MKNPAPRSIDALIQRGWVAGLFSIDTDGWQRTRLIQR